MKSIGVIGGADGPTAILLTSASPSPLLILLLVVGIFLCALAIFRIRKGKSKK